MAQKKRDEKRPEEECEPEEKKHHRGEPPAGGKHGGGTSGGGKEPGPGSTSTTSAATAAATQIQSTSTATTDAQTALQYTGLTQIRQARANQLQRQVTSLTQAYGANDPRVVAAQAALANQQTFASRLGLVQTDTSTTAPTAPANGWVIYGRVLNADNSPAPQLTVFLADETRAWLQQYAYAFTDQTGYFTLSSSSLGYQAQTFSVYLEVSNSACKLMYIDSSPMSIAVGASISRDIVLSANVPLGTAPCEPSAAPSTPPAQTLSPAKKQ
jgi:hypothetical protein